VRGDVVHPGHEACPIACGVEDDLWLPYVGREGLLLITRDKRIRRRLIEKQALVKYAVKALIMTQSGNSSMQDILDLVLRNWTYIERLADEPGPWIRSLTRTGISELLLPTVTIDD
jgi:hypothetical protein